MQGIKGIYTDTCMNIDSVTQLHKCIISQWSTAHPISRKIWRYSDLTFMRGCKCPAAGGTPRALKLYDLNDLVLHEPLWGREGGEGDWGGEVEEGRERVRRGRWGKREGEVEKGRKKREEKWCKRWEEGRCVVYINTHVAIISGVRSTSCLLICVVNSDPLLTTRLFVTLQ